MNTKELSEYFDVVLQSHTRQIDTNQNDPLEFDEYEKSVFITSSQEDFVSALYNKTGNFEVTEEDRRLLEKLVETKVYEEASDTERRHIKDGSQFYKLPDNLMFIVYEQCTMNGQGCIAERAFDVYPCTHDEYNVTKRNPFRGPNDHRVLRIDSGDGYVELVSDYGVAKYMIRYVRRPNPVILEDLAKTGLSINSKTGQMGCELDPQLHRRIVEHAVRKALQSKSIHLSK